MKDETAGGDSKKAARDASAILYFSMIAKLHARERSAESAGIESSRGGRANRGQERRRELAAGKKRHLSQELEERHAAAVHKVELEARNAVEAAARHGGDITRQVIRTEEGLAEVLATDALLRRGRAMSRHLRLLRATDRL